MASLTELPKVVRHVGLWKFCKKVWYEIGDDNLFTWAAALAYSWLFAVFPFFLTLLAIIPLLKSEWRAEAYDQIMHAIDQLPHEAAKTIGEYVQPKLNDLLGDYRPASITSLLSVGLLITLWASSGGMAMTMAAMDRAYDVERSRPIYKQRPLAILLTMIVAGLILAVIILIPVGTLVTRYLSDHADKVLMQAGIEKPATAPAPEREGATAKTPAQGQATTRISAERVHIHHQFRLFIDIWHVIRFSLSFLFLFWVVALVYHFGPNVKQKFRILTPGSVFTVATWILLGAVFRLYVDSFGGRSYGKTYGAVGGVIILLFFFYLDALVLLIGAEINAEVDAGLRAMAHKTIKPPPMEETKDTRPATETP
jgi:membrane protein